MMPLLSRPFYLISGVYLLPLLLWSMLALRELPPGKGIFYLGMGWLLMGACGLFLYFKFPTLMKESLLTVGEPFLEEVKKEREDHLTSIEALEEEKRLVEEEKQSLQDQLERFKMEALQLKTAGIDILRQKEKETEALKKQLHDHRHQIEEKQTLLQTLQGKVSDLTFEIKTLVEIHTRGEVSAPLPLGFDKKEPLSRESGLRILRRSIDVAKRQTGSPSFHGAEGSMSLTLDQRRLFELFLGEKGGIVFYFSPKEGKILFVNDVVEESLGCTPESFRFEFPKYILGSEEIWRQGVQLLSKELESEFHLPLKLRNGKEGLFSCTLGLIPSGIFKGDVIGVLT